ncbi:MAG: restriction endonuclease [Tepidisphaeraceae bacterium]
MHDLTGAIRQFDATEANLRRLGELWKEIEALIPQGMVIDTSSPDALRYATLCRTFRHIRQALPKVDGFELVDDLLDLDAIFMNRMDAKECGEISAEINVERLILAQGETLEEYRFRFAAQRRTLVRGAMTRAIGAVDTALSSLRGRAVQNHAAKIEGLDWEALNQAIAEISVLCGTAVKSPPRWSDLHRHLHFGMAGDLYDIITLDWPPAKESLQAEMYGPDDPIPVEVADLGALVKAAPTGPVVTALKWDTINDEDFERLVYNLVSDAVGYSNPQWLTRTHAADRGRDISATKTIDDSLSGSRVLRVIVQCKHWRTRSIGMEEISKLVNQMSLWEPPTVDEFVIASTGRFASDAVDWIEKHNHGRKPPLIAMWPDSHLESLLAARPHVVAQFRLR